MIFVDPNWWRAGSPSAKENFPWEATSPAWIDGVIAPIPLQVGPS